MGLSCEDVIRALSSYLDDEVTPLLRDKMELHLSVCRHCTAILNGTRNVLRLIAETRTFKLPRQFHQNLFRLVHERKLN